MCEPKLSCPHWLGFLGFLKFCNKFFSVDIYRFWTGELAVHASLPECNKLLPEKWGELFSQEKHSPKFYFWHHLVPRRPAATMVGDPLKTLGTFVSNNYAGNYKSKDCCIDLLDQWFNSQENHAILSTLQSCQARRDTFKAIAVTLWETHSNPWGLCSGVIERRFTEVSGRRNSHGRIVEPIMSLLTRFLWQQLPPVGTLSLGSNNWFWADTPPVSSLPMCMISSIKCCDFHDNSRSTRQHECFFHGLTASRHEPTWRFWKGEISKVLLSIQLLCT